MRKIFTAASIFCLIASLILTLPAYAESNEIRLFFAAQSMNESDEIILPIYIENVSGSSIKPRGVEFRFMYNTEVFTLKQDEDGRPLVQTSSAMLVSDTDKIDAEGNNGVVSVSYIDFETENAGILRDGPLFYFTLIPQNPKALWNSDDYYPLRFLPGSVNLITRDGQELSFTGTAVEGIDTYVGGYNVFPSFEIPTTSIIKAEFETGRAMVRINGSERPTDATPYEDGNEIMIPARYLAEALGAEIYWDDENQTAAMHMPYHSTYLDTDDAKVYINSKSRDELPQAVEINGRTYAALSVIRSAFGDIWNIRRSGSIVTIENN